MNAIAETDNNAANNAMEEKDYPNGLRAFTFWIADTLYAVDISNVLTISQDLSNIQSLPAQRKSLLGMTEFQGHAIPVVDFAHMLNLKSGTESSLELIQLLNEREKDHHDWLNALENSIIDGAPFLKAKDPNKCAFGQWYNKFQSKDETLMEIMSDFDEPHKRIHALADRLLDMRIAGEKEKALEILRLERDVTMKRLSKHFDHAREHVRDSSRKVLLYITGDGVTPQIALQIDEIHDVIDFKAEQFKPMSSLKRILSEEESKIIGKYIKINNGADCLLINATNIIHLIEA